MHYESNPLHGLSIGRTVEGLVSVRVCLFRSLLADCTFLNVASQVKRLVYEIDLATKDASGELGIG